MIEMEIVTCKKFNELQMNNWYKAVIWQRKHGRAAPSVKTYGIRNKNGELKKLGFVLCWKAEHGSNRHSWFKTKKEAVVKKRKARLAEINA